jgi:ornithine cyclodeaminase
MGADTPGKQELDTALLVRADVIVVDSISQCSDHGEVHKAVQSGLISATQLTQLGHVIDQTSAGRTTQTQITIADLTGVAVQDIQIATAVYRACLST